MATEVARTATATTLPVRPFSDPSLASLRNALGWVGGKPILMGNRRVTEAEMRTIKGHISILSRSLSCGAADDKVKAVEIAKMSMTFPQQGMDDVSLDLRNESYFEALVGLPAWAVAEARRRIVTGSTAFGRPWGPGPIEFADMVRDVLKPVRADLNDLRTIESVDPWHEPTPEERALIGALMDDLAASLRPSKADTRQSAIDRNRSLVRQSVVC